MLSEVICNQFTKDVYLLRVVCTVSWPMSVWCQLASIAYNRLSKLVTQCRNSDWCNILSVLAPQPNVVVCSCFFFFFGYCRHLAACQLFLRCSARTGPLLKPWIAAERVGTILCAHYNCMARLGEACSHNAALLFAVEAKHQLIEITKMMTAWSG